MIGGIAVSRILLCVITESKFPASSKFHATSSYSAFLCLQQANLFAVFENAQ
jgi:hypothetical protein